MLKFLRKYQLFILAVGGSLLMVVFLLEPILSRLAPNPANKTVAEFTSDGTEITRGDRDLARVEVQALGEYLRWMPGVLGLDADAPEDHWLLLTHAADKAGLIGGWDDGAGWSQDLIQQQLSIEVRALQSQGRFLGPQEQQQLLDNVRDYIENGRTQIAARYRMPQRAFDEILAKARGVARYRQLYAAAPRLSDRRLLDQAQATGSSALVDAVVLRPSLLTTVIEDPTDGEMREHLERYGAVEAGDFDDNPYGIG